MTQLLAYQFAITPGMRIATVESATTQARAQQLSVVIRTNLGERLLVPGFGIPDPAFRGLHADDVRAAVELFGPFKADEATPIEIIEVDQGAITRGMQEVEVHFDDE